MKTPIDFNEKPFSDILSNNLAINVLKDGKLGTYRHLTLPKDYDKTESNEYFLNTTLMKDISGLHWVDSRNLSANKSFIAFGDIVIRSIQCIVYTAGLNFKDVMMATVMTYFLKIIKLLSF